MFAFAVEGEIWRPIPDREGYFVSSLGRAASCHIDRAGRLLKQRIADNGYTMISFGVNGGATVNNLVARAFLGPPTGERTHAAHDDGDKRNNQLTNISWKTPKENDKDKYRHGTAQVGEKHPGAVLTADDVRTIRRRLDAGDGLGQIASDYPVNFAAIHKIKSRRTWKHVT